MSVSTPTYLYPDDDIPFTSNVFELVEDFGVIHVDGWSEGDSFCVETKVVLGCDNDLWVPYAPTCCGQVCICYPQSQYFFVIPGQYRLVFSNREDNHLTDPEWFSNLKVYGTKVSSNVDLTHLIEGCNSMNGCGPSVSCADGVGIIIDGELCQFPETHNPAEVTASDTVIEVIGSISDQTFQIGFNPVEAVNEICSDLNARQALVNCLPTVCEAISDFNISTNTIGG